MNRNDRINAARWAKDILQKSPVILDTETTGVGRVDEIISVAIVNHAGQTLLDTLVKPTYTRIPLEATQIHGIDQQMVSDAPVWDDIAPDVIRHIGDHPLVIYNADFDLRLMSQSSRTNAMQTVFFRLSQSIPVSCAMLQYADFWGDWNDYRQNYRWQRLEVACIQQHIQVPDLPAHSALGDCIRTLLLIKHMATFAVEREGVQS